MQAVVRCVEFLPRKYRDRALICCGLVLVLVTEASVWGPRHDVEQAGAAAATGAVLSIVGCLALAVKREREFKRMVPENARLPEISGRWASKELKLRLWAFYAHEALVYAWHDGLNVVALVTLFFTLMALLGSSAMAAMEDFSIAVLQRIMWSGATVIATLVLVGVTCLYCYLRRPALFKPQIGWHLAVALSIGIFYGLASGGLSLILGVPFCAMIGAFVVYYPIAPIVSGIATVGAILLVLGVPFFMWRRVFRSGFSVAPTAVTVVPETAPVSDGYRSLFEESLEPVDQDFLLQFVKTTAIHLRQRWDERSGRRKTSRVQAYAADVSMPLVPLLAQALADGRESVLDSLLERGADPNGMHAGEPMLIHAVKGGNAQCVLKLLQSGADPNKPAAKQQALRADLGTALMTAVAENKAACVRVLLANRAKLDVKTVQRSRTLIMIAIDTGAVEALEALLEYYREQPLRELRNILAAPDKYGEGAAQYAAKVQAGGTDLQKQAADLVSRAMANANM